METVEVYVLRLTPKWLEMPIVVLEFLGGLLNLVVFGPELRGAPCALLLDALVVPTVMAGKAKAPMMRFLQLRFVALVQKLGLNIEVGHEYGPFNPICDAGSRGKTAEMEAIMANLDLNLNYVDVPAEGLQLVDDAHAEWLRLSEAERAYAHAAADEEAARQRQHGASANSAPWPMVPPAREGAPRPRSEEERQTGRSRLNTDSSGASPYVYREVVTDDKFGMYNEVAPDDDLDEYTASSGGAAVRAAAVAAGGGPAEARRVRQRAGGRDAPSDVFGEAAAIAAGALQRRGLARQVDQMAAAQEMPPPRARRAAAALANVRLGENLYVESGGERQDQRTHEAASRARAAAAAARAAPEVVMIEGIAVTSHVSRAAVAAGVYTAAIARRTHVGGNGSSTHVVESYTPTGLGLGLEAEAAAPRVRVGLTAAGPTAEAPVGVTVEVVTLPLDRSRANAPERDAKADATAGDAAAAGVIIAGAAVAAAGVSRRKRRARCGTCDGCTRDESHQSSDPKSDALSIRPRNRE